MNATTQVDFQARATAFANIHGGSPCQDFAPNLHTEVTTFACGDLQLPVTVGNKTIANNAWVCSPCSAYGDYAAEEARRFGHPILTWPLFAVCKSIAALLRHGQLDRAVAINNWLLSTNLYPSFADRDAAAIRDAAVARWPDHSIWFRSLNAEHNGEWLKRLCSAGFQLIPSRQVYLLPDIEQAARQSSDLKSDLRMLRKTAYTTVSGSAFDEHDYARAAVLYGFLYTDKYSTLNPQYSARFIREWHQAGLLDLRGFRDAAGELQAVVGIFGDGSTLTAPIVGYNTALPKKAALYRLLMAQVAAVALQDRKNINFSAGAAQFKRLRGAIPAIEYSAVYSAHLPATRRGTIALLQTLAERIGEPLMKRFQL
jgi:hypothetical protein